MNVIWHDLECGAYAADLPLWRELAARHGDPVLDVGAGTGRVALDLASHGHHVTALDLDPLLLSELERRSEGLDVKTVLADARSFALEGRFALILAPMQTVQLLGGRAGRDRFLRRARAHLREGGTLAVAITEELDAFSPEDAVTLPLPDIRELDGVIYSSQPIAVRARPDGFVLERTRERVGIRGERSTEHDVIHLDRMTAGELVAEAAEAGFRHRMTKTIPATEDHVGGLVVILDG